VDSSAFGNEFSMEPIKEQRKGKSNKLQEVNVDDNQFNMISQGSSSQT